MGKSNVLDLKQISHKKLQEQFELQGCDEEILELVEKLVSCSPGSRDSKKKEQFKAELLNKGKERKGLSLGRTELSDEELDSAAGGIKIPEDSNHSLKKPSGNEDC